jgi:hypothetical protein
VRAAVPDPQSNATDVGIVTPVQCLDQDASEDTLLRGVDNIDLVIGNGQTDESIFPIAAGSN